MTKPFAPHLLTRSSHRDKPKTQAVRFLGGLSLRRVRAHEFCGAARRTLGLVLAGAMEGPVFWITPAWRPEHLHTEGIEPFVNPGRITFVSPKRAEDILWCMEEILRSGNVPLTVADIPGTPTMTSVRRLHLAAETGVEQGRIAPLGVVLTPGTGGAQGVESRWSLEPRHPDDTRSRWELKRLRARTEPVKTWRLQPGAAGQLVIADPAPITGDITET